MADSNSSKPGARPGAVSPPAPTRPANPNQTAAASGGQKPAAPAGVPGPSGSGVVNGAGRVVHDARGNAVWDWFKETTRVAVDSTSRLLKKLEVPGLKVEETPEEELRLESDRDAGGGYDPYGGGGAAPRGPNRTATPTGRSGGTGSGANKNIGGGYDPYQKSTPAKPGRKP